MTVLYVHELSVRRGPKPVLDRLSFHLDAGSVLGLVGGPASGKSLLCDLLLGLPTAPDVSVTGRILIANRNLATCDREAARAVRRENVAAYAADPMPATVGKGVVVIDRPIAPDALARLRAATDAGFIVTGRHADRLAGICDELAILCGGRIAERLPAAAFTRGRGCHPLTRILAERPAPTVTPVATGCPYLADCPSAAASCATAPHSCQIVDLDHETACLRWRDFVSVGAIDNRDPPTACSPRGTCSATPRHA